jgi:hypothetical protein
MNPECNCATETGAGRRSRVPTAVARSHVLLDFASTASVRKIESHPRGLMRTLGSQDASHLGMRSVIERSGCLLSAEPAPVQPLGSPRRFCVGFLNAALSRCRVLAIVVSSNVPGGQYVEFVKRHIWLLRLKTPGRARGAGRAPQTTGRASRAASGRSAG